MLPTLVTRTTSSPRSSGRPPRYPAPWGVPVLAVLALALPVTLGNAPALAAGAVGASITCTNGDAILGPLHSSVTLAPGTSGSLVLGGIDGGKGKYIGNCVLNGTVPAGWKVTEASWVDLSATSGSGNAGKLELETPNSTFVDTGTFTNSGTFEDASSGLTQMLLVGDFVNTGSVVAAGGAFGTAGMANNPTCPKCTFVDEGTVEVNPEQSFSSGSIFVLAPGGTIDDRGTFGIANESSFDIEGGSVTDGEPTSTQYLGLGAPTIKFGTGLPPTSHGSIDTPTPQTSKGLLPGTGLSTSPGGRWRRPTPAMPARSCGTTTTTQRFRTPRPLSIPGRSRTTRPGGRNTSRCPALSTRAQSFRKPPVSV